MIKIIKPSTIVEGFFYRFAKTLILLHFTSKNYFILFFFITFNLKASPFSEKVLLSINDSVPQWIKLSKHGNLTLIKRKYYLNKALDNLKADKNYSKYLSQIAYRFYKIHDTVKFLKLNKKAHAHALKTKDTLYIADTHWSYADFYNNTEVFNKSYIHYNEAYNFFKLLEKEYEMGRMLYAMGFIKGRYRDYSGSEVLTFKAIKFFKKKNKTKWLYGAYNHLAQLQDDIKEYDKSLYYYDKSLSYFNLLENKDKEYLGSYNNIANTYLKKKDFITALKYYNYELKKNIDISHRARVINNRAYCKLLMKDTLALKKDFIYALRIRDSIGNKTNILTSKINISDYYKYSKDITNALKYAQEANTLAKEIKNGADYLTTLKQLANLDIQNSKKYLDRYIEFNDSLISAERRTQNKFTRIEFETDEYIEETKRLNEQKIWIIAISIAVALILSLLYFLRVQKVKNEKLSLEAEQQKANEEVYILTLQQQAKLEEEKIKERNRISEELHDGILGKLFGTRFGLGFLPIKGNEDLLEKHQSYLNELQEIEKEIRDVSHKLSDNFDSSNINFITIIKQLMKDKREQGNFEYQFTFDDTISWSQINEVTKANIYRIVQEALQNILKHAKAKKVILEFSKNNQNLVLNLKDDGTGFDTKKAKKGIGLKNIKSRVEKLKGTVAFSSEIKKGTTLLIKIPYILNNE